MVTTPVGGIPDLVTHRETGLLLPVDNATELAGALVMVLEPISKSYFLLHLS